MLQYLETLLADFWATLLAMSPYLLFGFFFAGLLSVLVSQEVVERHLGGKGLWPLVKASLFGVPLPLCSCGVIPVSMSLHKHGASKGATIAFLLSTPQTGVDSIFVTYSLLGPVFAIFRPVAALLTGMVGGVFVDLFDRRGDDVTVPPKCTDDCCGAASKHHRFSRGFKFAFWTLPNDIGRELLAGLVIAAVISAIVPDNFFAESLGTGIFAMLVMMALGIPVYVCASASVPMAAAMIAKGLTPGAAFVFLMTGPATNAASFVTIYRILGHRTAIIYLISVAVCALAFGLALDHIGAAFARQTITHAHAILPPIVEYVCAIALLAILAPAVMRKKTRAEKQGR